MKVEFDEKFFLMKVVLMNLCFTSVTDVCRELQVDDDPSIPSQHYVSCPGEAPRW